MNKSKTKGLCYKTPEFRNKKQYINFVQSACSRGAAMISYKPAGALSRNERAAIGRELRKICRKNRVPFFVENETALAFYLDADGVRLNKQDLAKLPVFVIKKVARILEKKNFIVDTV